MQTQVEFRSSKFPPYEDEEEQINPGLWGKRLAEYLVQKLAEKGIETGEMVRELFPDADLLARTGSSQFAALSLGLPPAPDPLDVRAARWVEHRVGRASATPPLEYEACEFTLGSGDVSLADLLHAPLRQAAGMQK